MSRSLRASARNGAVRSSLGDAIQGAGSRWREIGPKTRLLGPIPAEMGGTRPKSQATSRAFAAAKAAQTSQIQG
jgi:hypothetical protein